MQFEIRFFRKTSEGFELELIEATCPTHAYGIATRMAKDNWADHWNMSISDGDTRDFEPVDPRKRQLRVS